MICVNLVTVSPKNITIKKGEWYYDLKKIVLPSDATHKNITWHSDNTSVATVNQSVCYIYGKSIGTAKIYATATDGSGCSDYATITVVKSTPATAVTLSKKSFSVKRGDCVALTTTVHPMGEALQTVTWSSSNSDVAVIRDNGIVYGIGIGTAVITATAADGSEKFDSCIVSVI